MSSSSLSLSFCLSSSFPAERSSISSACRPNSFSNCSRSSVDSFFSDVRALITSLPSCMTDSVSADLSAATWTSVVYSLSKELKSKLNTLSSDSNSSAAAFKLPALTELVTANSFALALLSWISPFELASWRWQASNCPAFALKAAFHFSRSAVINPHWTCQLARSALINSFWALLASSSCP